MRIVLVVISTLIGLSLAYAVPPELPNQQVLEQGRNDVRKMLLTRSCARCHTEKGSGATNGALMIFNLDESKWSARMTVQSLYGTRSRLISPTSKDPVLTLAEANKLASFVINEIVEKDTTIWQRK